MSLITAEVIIKGRKVRVAAWPLVVCGITSSGVPVPILVTAAGALT